MFDQEALRNKRSTPEVAEVSSKNTLSGLNVHELLALRADIDTFLPSQSIMEMDLESELLLQYHQTKALLAAVISEDDTPANQKAQLVNTCSSILNQITKSQTDLYNGERLKIMEQALINALKGVPDDVSEKFFSNYERELLNLDKK